MNKFRYYFREYFFRLLKITPVYFRKKAVGLFVWYKKWQLKKLKTPAMLILYVTNRCNARCSHCFYWQEVSQGVKKQLDFPSLEKISRSLVNPLTTLSITGGEPFLRNDLPQICNLFWKNNHVKKINIVTNGFFTAKIIATVRKIISLCPVEINVQVSLDGLKITHDRIRKINIYEQALETIKSLKTLSNKYKNFQVTIQTTISRDNIEEIVILGDFVKKNLPGIHHGFQFVRSPAFDVYNIDENILSGYDPRDKDPLLTVSEMKKANKILKTFNDSNNRLLNAYVKKMNEGIVKMKEKKIPFVHCLAGKYDAVIWPDGQVSVCEFTIPIADLKDYNYDFYRLWTSKKAGIMRQKTSRCYCTHTCNIMDAMQFDSRILNEILEDSLIS